MNSNLLPKALWTFFHELCQVPRASGNTQGVQDWLLNKAKLWNLEAYRDAVGNILICKAATPGMEHFPPVVLQSHMDMVCEKNSDSTHDFSKDPIEPVVKGEWLHAKETTLGADNGIGVAAQLAVLASDEIKHGPLECLFTVDEETGLVGALELQPQFFKAQKLINLDSEQDGEIFIGCAGGVTSFARFTFNMEKSPEKYFFFKVSVKGLLGGHSGDDIDKGRANANQVLARFLWQEMKQTDLRLVSFSGGNLSNVIPREATCIAAVPWEEKESVRVRLNCLIADLEEEYGLREPSLTLQLESVPVQDSVLLKSDAIRFIASIYCCINGIQAMSYTMNDLVDTSTNLASVKPVNEGEWMITTSQRSTYDSSKWDVVEKIQAHFALSGMEVSHGEGYPGWAPNPKSALLKTVKEAYVDLYQQEPRIRAIHAGLECGLFLKKYPTLDMVSFGPTMHGVHSPDERVHIPSVQRFWDLLVHTLQRIDS